MLDLFFRQRVDAGGPDLRDVDAQLEASVDHVEHSQDIGPYRLNLVVLAPVGVWRAALAGAVDDPGGLVLGKLAGGNLATPTARDLGLAVRLALWLGSARRPAPLGFARQVCSEKGGGLPQHLLTALYPSFGHDDRLALF